MKRFTELKGKKGFTLVEMIVVMAIIGILVALLAPNVAALIRDAQETSYDAKTKNIMTVMQAWNTKHIKDGYAFKGMTTGDSVVATWKSVSTLSADDCCVSIIKGADGPDNQNTNLSKLWLDNSATPQPTTIKVIGKGDSYLPENTVTGSDYAMVYMTQTGNVLGTALCNSNDKVLSVAGSVAARTTTTTDTWTNSVLRYKVMAPATGVIG